MQTSSNLESRSLWSARVIGWITLFFGIESGFVVASINWFRMGYKTKAFIHFAVAILIGCMNAFFLQDYFATSGLKTEEYVVRLLIRFGLVFLAIAYLHTATRKDINNLTQNEMTIKNGNWLFAALAGLVLFISFNFLGNTVLAYRLNALENHFYCEVLHPGMTLEEVEKALDEVGEHYVVNFDTYINTGELKVTPAELTPAHFWVASFRIDKKPLVRLIIRRGLGLGFDANNKLIWVSSYKPIQAIPIEVIQCP